MWITVFWCFWFWKSYWISETVWLCLKTVQVSNVVRIFYRTTNWFSRLICIMQWPPLFLSRDRYGLFFSVFFLSYFIIKCLNGFSATWVIRLVLFLDLFFVFKGNWYFFLAFLHFNQRFLNTGPITIIKVFIQIEIFLPSNRLFFQRFLNQRST